MDLEKAKEVQSLLINLHFNREGIKSDWTDEQTEKLGQYDLSDWVVANKTVREADQAFMNFTDDCLAELYIRTVCSKSFVTDIDLQKAAEAAPVVLQTPDDGYCVMITESAHASLCRLGYNGLPDEVVREEGNAADLYQWLNNEAEKLEDFGV